MYTLHHFYLISTTITAIRDETRLTSMYITYTVYTVCNNQVIRPMQQIPLQICKFKFPFLFFLIVYESLQELSKICVGLFNK